MKKLKNVIAVFFLLSGLLISSQEMEIRVEFSKKNAVLIFLENLSEDDENEFKIEYNNSIYNTDVNNKYIEDFKNLDLYFSKNRFKSTRYFKSICIKSNSWNEIRERSIGLFPDETINKLIMLLQHFEPIYDEVIYQPLKLSFTNQLEIMEALVKKKNMDALFGAVRNFFDSHWSRNSSLIVTFYPIPNGDGFTAKTYGNTITSGIPSEFKDFPTLFSVLIHEVAHLMFYNTSETVSQIMEDVWSKHESKTAVYAKHLFDEAMATVIGNGVIYKYLTGSKDKRSWYYHKYHDLMARSMYDLTEQYLNDKKTIDRNYMLSYMDTYERLYMGWLGEPKNLMTYHTILANEKTPIDYLRSKFRYGYYYDNHEPISLENLKKVNDQELTKIILIDKNHREVLGLIKDVFHLDTILFSYNKNFIYNVLLPDKTQLIIINSYDINILQMIDSFSGIKNLSLDSGLITY